MERGCVPRIRRYRYARATRPTLIWNLASCLAWGPHRYTRVAGTSHAVIDKRAGIAAIFTT